MTAADSLDVPNGGLGTAFRGSLRVERPHYPQWRLNEMCQYSKPKQKLCRAKLNKCSGAGLWRFLTKFIPALKWVPEYDFKSSFIGDLVAGITVAIMHIPQGMGYALLGNLPPVVGIYAAFFPVIIYFLLGTGRHNSMGSFAVICLMVGQTVLSHSSAGGDGSGGQYTPTQVGAAVCFMCGIIQLIMFVLRLGVVTSLLSETLISGFTTGAAVHVLTSQINGLLGLKGAKDRNSYFQLIYNYIDIFENFKHVNLTAVLISAITIIVIVINNELVKPRLARYCSIPVPIELIAVVTGTLASRFGELRETYGIPTVGDIPTGFPEWSMPPPSLLADVAVDSIPVAMVSFAVSMSMALIFAQKLGYRVRANQELLAQGCGNLFGSFFGCMPFAASISRTTIQESVGGRTQLASLVACGLLAIVLLWIGPFFEPLPKCVLASVIVVALKGMLMQVTDFRNFLQLSVVDAVVWMVTFLTVVLISIDIGLLVGLILSLMSLLIRGLSPYACLLGNVQNTDLYLDMTRYKGTVHPKGVRVFHYCGGLSFASKQHFRSVLCRMVDCDPSKLSKQKLDNTLKENDPNSNTDLNEWRELSCVVVDCSAVMYIDPSAAKALETLAQQFSDCGILFYLANCSCKVYETIRKCCSTEGKSMKIFPSVHDAVHAAKREIKPVTIDVYM